MRGKLDVSLYEQAGGDDAIAAAVDSFYKRLLDDPIVAGWFAGIDLDDLKEHQRAFLAVGLGGPELYDGRSMRTAHSGLGITDDAYTRTLTHLADALTDLGVEASVVAQIVRRIELMRAAIVETR